jgi:hypothetical protein
VAGRARLAARRCSANRVYGPPAPGRIRQRAGRLAARFNSKQEQDFFFEKKKQKTFVHLVRDSAAKSFLVLFFKKGRLASCQLRQQATDCVRQVG